MAPLVRVAASAGAVMLLAAACSSPRGGPNENLLPAADAERNIRLMITYDANSDGTVTREELEAGLRRQFAAADTNGDGRLSTPETQAENDRRYKANGIASSPLIDWNQDAFISYEEFATTARSLFDALDKDRDGKLDGDELMVPRMRGMRGRGPRGGGPPGEMGPGQRN
jgi:Ca2+-binding EF-hand superfamily protein